MAKVSLDIAGFYYSMEGVEVEDGAPVFDLMQAVAGVPTSTGAVLAFDTEPMEDPKFLDSITITHSNGSARSRQKSGQADGSFAPSTRTYEDGIYANADEAGFFLEGTNTSPFVAADRNKTGLMVWQYYVYDHKFVDINRAGGPRRVVPFVNDFSRPDGQRGLQDRDTVVWRLIQIRTRPDGGLGPQTIRLDQTLAV